MENFCMMNINEVAMKSKSKKEAYDLMTTEGDIYLPLLGDTNYKFIAQIMCEDKLYLKCSEVKGCEVSHFKTFKVGDLIEYARQNTSIDEFLPDYNYQKQPNREWLCNVINTVVGERFRAFIMQRQQERIEYILDKKQMKVRALPEFIKLFQDSTSISTHKGRTYFLINSLSNKMWGNYPKNKNEKLCDAEKEIELLRLGLKRAEEKLTSMENIEKENDKHKAKLAKLYELEVIDSDGEPK